MSSRWALLGNALGQGASAGLGNYAKTVAGPQLQIMAAERAGIDVSPEMKKMMYLSSALGGGSAGNGLYNLYLMNSILGGGGGLDGLFGGNLGSTGMTSAPTGDNNDGVGNIVYTNTKTEPGMIEVRELATGQIGLLPENEFDPAKYQRTKP